jgi:hypothetical protein
LRLRSEKGNQRRRYCHLEFVRRRKVNIPSIIVQAPIIVQAVAMTSSIHKTL